MATIRTIKGERQKTGSNSFSDYLPFGVDGEYVDMLSGLTLERELKLGQDHAVNIIQNDDESITIVEDYATPSALKFYRVKTNINTNADSITQRLYWVENGQETLKKSKQISIKENSNGFNIQEVLS